jgi:hypothetical protein
MQVFPDLLGAQTFRCPSEVDLLLELMLNLHSAPT